MSFVSTSSTSRWLHVSCWLSMYSSMFLWFNLFIRNNNLFFMDEVISWRTSNNNLVKRCKQRYGHTLHVCISRLQCSKICTHEIAYKVFSTCTEELWIVPIILLMIIRLWSEFIWLSMWWQSFIMHAGNRWLTLL